MATISQIAAPQGCRGPLVIRVRRHSAETPAALGSGDNFADRSPPGMARFPGDLRKTSLRCTPQQPPKVAT
eukprot:2658681-Pyramimonas_sp.AAC.1